MKLHFRTLGEGNPLIILHGVFGSSDNWQTLGKFFSEKFKVYLVDLRNHGNSPHSEEFNYDVMAEDVAELIKSEGLSASHILGHSMGGKVAMHLATHHAQLLHKLIVVDIAPKYYPPHHQQIFEGFHAVDLKNLENRKQADEQMSLAIPQFGIRQFILKNLERKKDGSFSWKLNLTAIENAIEEVGGSISSNVSFKGETLFIAGGNSDYITEQDYNHIQKCFSQASIVTIAGAGHWVHAEKPKELSNTVMNFLSE